MLKDSFGRIINNLRISVTDRCNFRCVYCMPANGMKWMDRSEILSFEEISRLAKIFSELGVTKLRLTGGEPLLRHELTLLVNMLSSIETISDISLTTNGYLLEEQAEALFLSGLRRINISLDSLKNESFNEITRGNYYRKVKKGISIASDIGFIPIKLNVVLIRGFNDNEILNFAELARRKGFIIRFIEFMPIGNDDKWNMDSVVTSAEIIDTIQHGLGLKLRPKSKRGPEPADSYIFEDGVGEIGFISSISKPFCEHCNRVRITSDGKLRTCLFSVGETDLKELMRKGASDRDIQNLISDAVSRKERGHMINKPGFIRPKRTMSQIGG